KGILFVISLQMLTRRVLTDSMTESDDKVRSMNLFNAPQNLLRTSSGNFELKKPGTASKNFSTLSSSPRTPIVQSKMRISNSDDRSATVFSTAPSKPPNIRP
ncbi:hypothetical protein BJV77DRAFT_1018623, partial [Russula vinacea]